MDRRRFVRIAGSTVLVGIAGCLHAGGDGDFGSPTAVVEPYYEAIEDASDGLSGEEWVEELDEYLHSESPYRDLWEDRSAEEMQGDGRTVDSVETEVTDEDLSAEELQEEFSGGFFNVSDDSIDAIADDNAVVEATLTFEESEEEAALEHINAPEDGNWQIFFALPTD